ncbi:TonB-dependent receptor [Sporomusa sp. KB1]|jgi:iron complex outermembrane receptor protein|uniref:TonB-dependent receptor n=1 Tax=Sporomusa sp. KB1 TaxID=943346 RepID=UPI0011A8AFFA|nr:TonB-dependent receptor [Sporomusa sp. KB1]TWH46493.1 iron complex outermembrane receptor protein [Sporomusa sp. KB1]
MIGKKLISTVCLATVACMPLAAFAEPSDPKESSELSPVVVSANKVKKQDEKQDNQETVSSRLTVPESAKSGMEVFTRKDIEAMHPRNVFDILEQAKGIVVTYQGRKHPYFIRDRGGDQMGIILDGVYLPWSAVSRVVASLPVNMIESVKVVRDSTVLTIAPMGPFGADQAASGQGFIIITTKKATSPETELSIGYGSLNTQKYQVFYGDKKDKLSYNIGYTKAKTDGKDNWYNFSDSDSILLKGGYSDKGFSSNLMLYHDRTTSPFQRGLESNGKLSSAKWGYDPMETTVVAYDMAKQWNKLNTTSFSFSYTKIDSDFHQDTFGKAPVAAVKYVDYWREYNLWHTIAADKDTLKFGTQYISWHTPTGTVNFEGKEQQESLYGYYLTDEHRVDDRWTVDGGIRLDKRHIISGTGEITKRINDQWAQDGVTYSLGTSYKLNSLYKLSTRLAYSRQPVSEYLIPISGVTLHGEKRWKYETGITADYNKAFNVALTAFYYNIDNCKIADGTTGSGVNLTSTYKEADVGRRGMELGINGQLSDQWKYDLSYSYINSSNADDNSQLSTNTYTLRLNYKNKNIAANVTALHLDPFLSNGKKAGNFNRVDANISKELDKNRTLTLYARNIGDVQYATIYRPSLGYFYDVGRTYGVEMSMKF